MRALINAGVADNDYVMKVVFNPGEFVGIGMVGLMRARERYRNFDIYRMRDAVPIEDAQSLPPQAGVYVAWGDCRLNDKPEPVYVGESKGIRKRLADRPELCGTRIVAHYCKPEDRKCLEAFLIAVLDPPLNGASSYGLNPIKAANEFLPAIWNATVEEAKSRDGSAILKRVALRCYQRERAVRLAWRKLQKIERLAILNGRAIVRTYTPLKSL